MELLFGGFKKQCKLVFNEVYMCIYMDRFFFNEQVRFQFG